MKSGGRRKDAGAYGEYDIGIMVRILVSDSSMEQRWAFIG